MFCHGSESVRHLLGGDSRGVSVRSLETKQNFLQGAIAALLWALCTVFQCPLWPEGGPTTVHAGVVRSSFRSRCGSEKRVFT